MEDLKKNLKRCKLKNDRIGQDILMGCQQQASEAENPVCQINAQSQTALRYTPKQYSV